MKNSQVAIMIEQFDHKFSSMIEDFDSKLDVILEMLTTKASIEDVKRVETRMARMEQTQIKQGERMADYDWLFKNHEHRINRLETT